MPASAAIDQNAKPADALDVSKERDEARAMLINSGLMDADRLAYISRDLSLVPKEERRALFVARAKTGGELVRDDLLNAAAVHEKLWQIAHAHGLVGLSGSAGEEFIAYVIDNAVALTDEQGQEWRRRWRL
jgi:hypothetical protein